MYSRRKSVRVVRVILLLGSGVSLLLYAASFRGITWVASTGNSVGVIRGSFRIQYNDPSFYTARAFPGLHIGKLPLKGSAVTLPAMGPKKRTLNTGWWGFWVYLLRAPPGVSPTLLDLQAGVPLGRVALMLGMPGGLLLLVPTRRRPGACPACGYNLSGLAAVEARCPECGAASVGAPG